MSRPQISPRATAAAELSYRVNRAYAWLSPWNKRMTSDRINRTSASNPAVVPERDFPLKGSL